MTKKQLEVRIETINTLIATFGDEDGRLGKELDDIFKELKTQEVTKRLEIARK